MAVLPPGPLAESVRIELEAQTRLTVVDNIQAALAHLLEYEVVDVAVLLESADSGTAVARASELRRLRHALPVIVLSRKPDSHDVTAALRGKQVSWVVPVPWHHGALIAAIERAHETSRLRRELDTTRTQLHRRLEMMSAMNELTGEIADAHSYEQLARVAAQGLFRVSPEGIGAVLLVTVSEHAYLHLHCPQPSDRHALRAIRDRAMHVFHTFVGRDIVEDRLNMEMSGDGMSIEPEREYSQVFTHAPVTTDGRTVGVIVLATSAGVNTTAEKLMFFVANRVAEMFRRLSLQREGERHRLGLMVESMADGLIFYDTSSDEVLINPAARRMLRIDAAADVTGQRLESALGFHPLTRMSTTSRRSTEVIRQELQLGDRTLHSIVSAVSDTDGVVVGVVVVLRDISDARELARRQRDFVSMMSHELRTPLTSIAGILDMCLNGHAGLLSDKQRKYLSLARDSYHQLDGLISNLLDVARSERNDMLDDVSLVDLHELSRSAVEQFRVDAEAKDIQLHIRTAEQRIRILGDGPRIAQVLDNLISNAIKFTPQTGEVEVEVFGESAVAEHVGVSVFNTGAPIPREARERVFAKFEQLEDLSTRGTGGAGLGLPISRAIVEAHGGRLWAESLSEGTRFVFILPIAPNTDERESEHTHDDAQRIIGPLVGRHGGATDSAPIPGTQVLVVDDGQHSSFMLSGLLLAAGYEVSSAKDAESALSMARSQSLRLAVISIAEPSSASADLVDIFTHDPEMRKTAVLVVSSNSDVRDVALRSNANQFLRMPVEQGEFLNACTNLVLEAGHTSANRVLVVDDDATIRMICRDILEQAGYDVTDAGDGATALDLAKRHKPHVMLLDIMMPKMDGFEIASKMRTDPATSMTPIIFVSAKGETADKVRAFRAGAEDYMVKPFDAQELVARVDKSVERQARELGASPTTQLPGADAIEAEIERRLALAGDDAYCYLDLDNLKAFNDYYGYAKADGVIRQIGDIIRDAVARDGSPGDFIGHIAGDDFVFFTNASRVTDVCTNICTTFDRLIPLYYNQADRERGFIEAKDRYGVLRKFPIMTVSLAVVTPMEERLQSFSDLAMLAARGKKLAKKLIGSSFVCDGQPIMGRAPTDNNIAADIVESNAVSPATATPDTDESTAIDDVS